MVNVKVSRVLHGDPERIWDLINAVDRFKEWMPGVIEAKIKGRRKKGVGRQQILTTETKLGKGKSLLQVVAWEPPKKVTWQHLSDIIDGKEFTPAREIKTTLSITNIDGKVTLRMVGSWIPNGISGKLMNRMMKHTVSTTFDQALDNLEKLIARNGAAHA